MNRQAIGCETITTADELRAFLNLSEEEYGRIRDEIVVFPMSVPKYYLSLIDPADPDDPIRKMCVPSGLSAVADGELDTSGEMSNTVIPGLQHKYAQTVLILSTAQCAMYCRHCFRRRLVGMESQEVCDDIESAVKYIESHPEVTNVLISGGDAFMLPTGRIGEWLSRLSLLPQLSFIRFGTRTPVTFPRRILDDPELIDVLSRYGKNKQIYVVTHFNHPKEMTSESEAAIRMLQGAGVVIKNQTVLLKGVNDKAEVLGPLLMRLTSWGVTPHYIFQCRPVKGVKSLFQVPLGEGLDIVARANAMQNGLGKTADYTMSHVTGKIRVLGRQPDGQLVFQYRQAKDPAMIGKIFTAYADDRTWL